MVRDVREPQYWLTIHWPPFEGTDRATAPPPEGVFTQLKYPNIGMEMRPDDRVFIYETGNCGDPEWQYNAEKNTWEDVARMNGRGGVIALVRVCDLLAADPEARTVYYRGGTKSRAWRRLAHTEPLNATGFVQCSRVLDIIQRATMQITGGLILLKQEQGIALRDELVRMSRESLPPKTLLPPKVPRHHFRADGGEGPEHEGLKLRIWSRPNETLGTVGLVSEGKECEFVTGDRVDVVLSDDVNRYITVEVKVAIAPGDKGGVLQAVKYRHMYAVECGRLYEEIRAFLVAYEIPEDIRALCDRYKVEWFVVSRDGRMLARSIR